jgi:MoxR-like ATPase
VKPEQVILKHLEFAKMYGASKETLKKMTNNSNQSWETLVTDKIKEKMRQEKERQTVGGKITEEVMKKTKAAKAPEFFTGNDYPDTTGKVLLSSLVPSWDHIRGTFDPYVTVYAQDAYSEAQATFIPDPMVGYRPNQESLAQLAYAIESTDLPTWLSGDASVGKSSLVQYYCHLTGRPFRRVNFNGHITSEDILGKQSFNGGELKWHDGIVPEAMQIPHGILLLDEPTAAPAEIQLSLQYALERNGKLLLTNKPCDSKDAFVVPAEDFHFVLADNTVGMGDTTGRFIGTQPQNTAWLDRMGTFLMVDWLPAEDEQKMLVGLYPAISDYLASKIVSTANLLRNGMKQGNLSVCMSMRVTQAWCMHASNLRDIKQAFTMAFLNRLDNASEREAAEEVYRNIFG